METVEARVTWYASPQGGELGVDEEPQTTNWGLRKLHPRADAVMELDAEGGRETGNVVGVTVRWFLFFEAWDTIPETGKLWRQAPRHRSHPPEALPLVDLLRHKQMRLLERQARQDRRAEATAERRRMRGGEPSWGDTPAWTR